MQVEYHHNTIQRNQEEKHTLIPLEEEDQWENPSDHPDKQYHP